MELNIVFKDMDRTEAIEEYVLKNVEKFKKYLGKEDPEATFVHVVFQGKKGHEFGKNKQGIYKVEIRVKTPHFDLIVDRENNNEMYSLIDEVVHIMERKLQDAKEKFLDSIHKVKKPNQNI